MLRNDSNSATGLAIVYFNSVMGIKLRLVNAAKIVIKITEATLLILILWESYASQAPHGSLIARSYLPIESWVEGHK